MFDFINQDILGFDVSVGNRQHGQIVESSEYLVGIDFDEQTIHLFLFDDLVEVVSEIVHDNVKVLGLAFVGEEAVLHD